MRKIYTLFFSCCLFFAANSQWSDNTERNLELSKAGSDDIVTVNNKTSGTVWTAFYSTNAVTFNFDMRVQLINHDGTKVFGDSGLVIGTKKSGTATFVFSAAVDESNNIYVAYQYQKGSAYTTLIQKVTPSGELPWGKNGIDLGPGLSPYPAVLTNGEVVVAWNNNGVINYQKISQDGVKTWDPAKEITSSTGHTVTRAQVVANTNALFSIVYQDLFAFPIYTNLYMQRFRNNGKPDWTSAKKISTLTTAAARYYDVMADDDNVIVGYYGNPPLSNRFDAFVQVVNRNGSLPLGANGAAFSDYASDFDPYEQTINIAHDNGDLYAYAVCTFTNPDQTSSGVYAQKINLQNGKRLFGDTAKKLYPISKDLLAITGGGLGHSKDGCLRFSFTDLQNRLYSGGFDEKGKYLTKDKYTILCSTIHAKLRFGFAYSPAVAAGESDEFVAVWQEDKGDGDRPYAQNISCDGTIGQSKSNAAIAADVQDVKIVAASGVKVYPNPATDKIYLTLNSASSTRATIIISDAQGRIVNQKEQTLNLNSNVIEMNVQHLPAGMYFIRISGNGIKDNTAKSFIKQ